MNIEQYMIEIQRTWNAGDWTQAEQLSNAALGLVGKVGEYMADRVLMELGDVAFYTFTLARLLGYETGAPWGHKRSMHQVAASIAERVKKLEFHDPGQMRQISIMEGLYDDIDQMVTHIRLHAVCEVTGRDFLGEVLAANIHKLRARYPDGFVPGGGVR